MVPYQCKDIPQGLFRHRYTLAQKKGEPREENPLRLITVELLEFTRHIGLEGCGDVAHKVICEIRAIVKGESGIKLDVETLKSCFQGGIWDKLDGIFTSPNQKHYDR